MLYIVLATALPEMPPVQQQAPAREQAFLARSIKEGHTANERKFGNCHFAWGLWNAYFDGDRITICHFQDDSV